MDKDSLLNIVIEKNKRIEDLERLVEEQRRLRFQDASQVEEKAAKIKEWVANKLKELENQNKLLRDQNKKQKEIIEVLNKKLESFNSSPIKISHNQKTPNNLNDEDARESPIYDSVNAEQLQSIIINSKQANKKNSSILEEEEEKEQQPPPPPLHQSDKWELNLYNLADETLTTLIRQHSLEDDDNSSNSRKSSLSSKNDLILLVKPSFTTIDGDNVVDSTIDQEDNCDSGCDYSLGPSTKPQNGHGLYQQNTPEQEQSIHKVNKLTRKDSSNTYDLCPHDDKTPKLASSNLFGSPMRTKSGKDNILRTQSVRRNPTPGKLYDFILADLVKRGYLIKSGALKNHSRWFVLKNFHLHSYKSESMETLKATPGIKIRLDYNCQVQSLNTNQSVSESNFPFKITYLDKSLVLIAPSAQVRDEWIRILTVTINMSDIEPDTLTKNNSTHEGLVTITTHGHSKRFHATLINHILFFLRSITDPTPMNYISVKDSKIREITDSHDYDDEEQEMLKQKNHSINDCSLAIYPKFSMKSDPIYITLGNQQDTDKWLYNLSLASGTDQSHGTQFERALSKIMIKNSIDLPKSSHGYNDKSSTFESRSTNCVWKGDSLMLYTSQPIAEPLTSLPNETLRVEAIELFKSMQLFTQVPLEPLAIDYHVCLLKNCLSRFLAHPELRNEFYAQLIKQSTWILHRCGSPKLSIASDGNASPSIQYDQRNSLSSGSQISFGECQFMTDVDQLDQSQDLRRRSKTLASQSHSCNKSLAKDKRDSIPQDEDRPPTQSELIQALQILAVAVSLHLPRGRMRWWLIDHLRKFADQQTNIGKYALYALRAIDRTFMNGPRDNVPSRTEIMSILLRNPYDHSNPHSLPINFCDGSYLVVGADGSTTIEEFMSSMTKSINIRHSMFSDFYLFANDPSGGDHLHILEPKRKVLDIVGWWEESFRKQNSGLYQNSRFIKLLCKKRLVLRAEEGETNQERMMIVQQVNQEIATTNKIQLNTSLTLELATIMAQFTFGDFDKIDSSSIRSIINRIADSFLPEKLKISDNINNNNQVEGLDHETHRQLMIRWQHLKGKSSQDCIRVYLNCIRRLNLDL